MKKFGYLLLLICSACYAQDRYFVNNTKSLVLLNPSFAGSNEGLRNQTIYRTTLPRYNYLPFFYSTLQECFDMYIKPVNGAVAFSYQRDRYDNGLMLSNAFNVAYAQYISFSHDLQLIPSVQVGYIDRTVDYEKGYAPFWGDCAVGYPDGPLRVTASSFDVGSGFLMRYKSFYLGSSLLHINKPLLEMPGSKPIPRQFTLHASVNTKVFHKNQLNFSGRYTSQGGARRGQMMVSAIFMKHLLLGGGFTSLRNDLGTAGVVSAGFRNNWTSLQITYNGLFHRFGAWEAGLSFSLRKKDQPGEIAYFERW